MADYSGTITSGTNSQEAAAADAMRQTLMMQNTSDTDMAYYFGAAAVQATSIQFLVGDTHFWPKGFEKLISQSINIIGPTTGKTFIILSANR